MAKSATKSAAIIKLDAEVPSVLETLNKRIASLKAITECNYRTGGNLDGFGDIKSETKVENLIRAFSSVQGRAAAYEKAAATLGIQTYPEFRLGGGNVEDWKHDIQLRIAVIEHKQTLDKLNEFKAKAEKFLSEEDQKSMLFKEMSNFLGSNPMLTGE